MRKKTIYICGEAKTIDLDNLEYNNGLAVSVVVMNHWRTDEEIVYLGVWDETGQEVLPYQAYYKDIEIFPCKNLIVKVRKGNDDGTVTWIETRHYRHNGKILELVNDKISSSYKKINDKVIKTYTCTDEGKKCMVLYDVIKGENISEEFSKIGDFKMRPNGEELACATTILTVGEGQNDSYDMDCYINEKGIIRTPIYNSYSNNIMIFDTSSSYKDAIKKIYTKMKEEEELKSKEKQKVLETFWNLKI